MFMPFARFVAATCGFARSADVDPTLDIDSPLDAITANNSCSSSRNNNDTSSSEDEDEVSDCMLLEIAGDSDAATDNNNTTTNNQTRQEPLRVQGVGWNNMCVSRLFNTTDEIAYHPVHSQLRSATYRENEVLVAPAPAQREAKSNVIFFPGDVQDFSANMASGAFSEFSEFAYERVAAVLADKFGGDCNVWVIRPAHFFQRAFSCFDNFVETNEIGAATACTCDASHRPPLDLEEASELN